MNYLEYYFGQHREKQIIYILGKKSDGLSFKNIVNMCNFEKFYLVLETRENEIDSFKSPENIVEINHDELLKFGKKMRDFTVIFDNVEIKHYLDCFSSHPKKIVGCFNESVSTFDLWEILRNYSEEVVLGSMVCKEKTDVLEWRKDETDVELSVILPVYNVSKYLVKCIESLTQWEAPYVEFLFVDDGSPDNSSEIIKEYQKKDPRIKLLSKTNGGCASAREFGLEKSNGKYIGFVDPDDFIDPTMFRKLLSAAFRGGYDISYSRYFEYYEDTGLSKEITDIATPVYTFGTTDTKSIDALISGLRVAIWRCIYKKSFLLKENIHFYLDLKRFDDLPFKVETFARANSVICVDEPLYYYRLGREGQDVSVHDERLYVHFEIFKHLDKFFEKLKRSEHKYLYYEVKIQTHYWAIINLDKEFLNKYFELASVDLNISNNKSSWNKLFSQRFKGAELRKIKDIISSLHF